MRRLIQLTVLSLLTFLFWSAVPAYANNVPVDEVAVSCTGVDLSWHDFPTHPVDLTVSVLFDDQNSTHVISTGGAKDGVGSVPLALHGSGTASVLVTWTLRKDHHSGPITADLTCDTPTTSSPPATAPPRTPATYRMIPPVTAGPELPNTGAASTGLLLLGGWMILGLGAALVWGAHTRRTEQ